VEYTFLDTEFNNTLGRKLNLVSACLMSNRQELVEYWLHNNPHSVRNLRKYILKLHERGTIFVSYGVMAEARAFLAMDLPVRDFSWIDLYAEHKCLINHSHKYGYGRQLIGGEVVKTIPPKPKWEQTEADLKQNNGKVTPSYASACYKFLDIKVDTERKTVMRDLIISSPEEFSVKERIEIMDYCRDDTVNLRPLFKKMRAIYQKHYTLNEKRDLLGYMLNRGSWATANAVIEQEGYPIDYESTKNFSYSVPEIVTDLQRDINSQFKEGPFQPFRYKKMTGIYGWNQKATREWIKTLDKSVKGNWLMTDGGKRKIKQRSLIILGEMLEHKLLDILKQNNRLMGSSYRVKGRRKPSGIPLAQTNGSVLFLTYTEVSLRGINPPPPDLYFLSLLGCGPSFNPQREE